MSLFDIYYYTDKVSFLDVQFSNCGEKEKKLKNYANFQDWFQNYMTLSFFKFQDLTIKICISRFSSQSYGTLLMALQSYRN